MSESITLDDNTIVIKVKVEGDDDVTFSFEMYNMLTDHDYYAIRDGEIDGLEPIGKLIKTLEEL